MQDNKVLWSNPSHAVPRGVRGHDDRRRPPTSPPFFGQDVNALDRMATEFARSSSARSSRRSDAGGHGLGAVRKQIGQRQTDPVYLIVGDDEAQMAGLADDLGGLVEDELRAFNLERMYATDKGVTPSTIVQAARTLPMLGDRRVVIVLQRRADPETETARARRPRTRTRTTTKERAAERSRRARELPQEPRAADTLVLVATDADRQRKVYKTLQKHASIVECWGLKGSRDGKVDLRQVGADRRGDRASRR